MKLRSEHVEVRKYAVWLEHFLQSVVATVLVASSSLLQNRAATLLDGVHRRCPGTRALTVLLALGVASGAINALPNATADTVPVVVTGAAVEALAQLAGRATVLPSARAAAEEGWHLSRCVLHAVVAAVVVEPAGTTIFISCEAVASPAKRNEAVVAYLSVLQVAVGANHSLCASCAAVARQVARARVQTGIRALEGAVLVCEADEIAQIVVHAELARCAVLGRDGVTGSENWIVDPEAVGEVAVAVALASDWVALAVSREAVYRGVAEYFAVCSVQVVSTVVLLVAVGTLGSVQGVPRAPRAVVVAEVGRLQALVALVVERGSADNSFAINAIVVSLTHTALVDPRMHHLATKTLRRV